MENLEIYNNLSEVPDWAKKKIKGGDISGMTDISPQWRIKAMTEQFGVVGIGWYYEVTKQWLEPHGSTVSAFVNINLYIKVGNEWSKPIPGNGGNIFAREVKDKDYTKVSDECYKMATTDALSVAMKMLGVGADVYSGFQDSKYKGSNNSQAPNNPNKGDDDKHWFNPKNKDNTLTDQGRIFIQKAKEKGRKEFIAEIEAYYKTSKPTKEWMERVELK